MSRPNIFNRASRAAYRPFMRIEEPRVVRVFWFLIYLTLFATSATFLADLPRSVLEVMGATITVSMGLAVAVGAAVGTFGVLPGVWRLERIAIISIASGAGMYITALFALGASSMPIGLVFALILSLALRWSEVRKYQHAPGK